MENSLLVKTPVHEELNGEIEIVFSFHGRKENHDSWSVLCKLET